MPILISIAIVILIAIAIVVIVFIKGHGMLTLIARFIIGHHMDGKERTNSGMFRRGDKILHRSGKASRYAHLSHIEIALIRWMTVIFTISLIYGLFNDFEYTVIALIVTPILIIALNLKRIERKYAGMAVNRGTKRPLADAMALHFQTTPEIAAQSISIVPNYATAKSQQHIGTIILPNHWSAIGMGKSQIEDLITSRIGIDVDYTWHTSKSPMTLEITRAPIPPKLVPFADKMDIMNGLNDDKVLLGTDGKATDHYWDMASEEPMAAIQATSRRGKTRLLLLICSQILNKGGSVYAIDPKRVGIRDALANVPKAKIWDNPRDIEGSWKLIHEVKELLDERIDQYQADRTVQFKRVLLVIDETSMWSAMGKRHWQKVKPKKAPAKPIVWDDIAELCYMAAFVKINIVLVGQRLDQRNMEGLLESFGTRMAAGFTKQSYMRFIGTSPVPVSPKARGRFILFDGESTHSIQCVLGSDIELNDYALANTPMHDRVIHTEKDMPIVVKSLHENNDANNEHNDDIITFIDRRHKNRQESS